MAATPSGNFGPVQHCRRARAARQSRVLEIPEHCARIAHGTRHAGRDRSTTPLLRADERFIGGDRDRGDLADDWHTATTAHADRHKQGLEELQKKEKAEGLLASPPALACGLWP